MKIWLDDVRPAPDGWVHLESYRDFISFMTCGHCLGPQGLEAIEEMSLDHDLGLCERCVFSKQTGEHKCSTGKQCSCNCHKSGYDVVCWLETNNMWPPNKPTVHSMNPVGRQRMLQVINQYYNG